MLNIGNGSEGDEQYWVFIKVIARPNIHTMAVLYDLFSLCFYKAKLCELVNYFSYLIYDLSRFIFFISSLTNALLGSWLLVNSHILAEIIHYMATHRTNHVAVEQCPCAQNKLHEDKVCQGWCEGTWKNPTELSLKLLKCWLHSRRPHPTSVPDHTNALVVKWTQISTATLQI